MKNTGFFDGWFDSEKRIPFNCNKNPVPIHVINRNLEADRRKVFHPFYDFYPLEPLRDGMKSKAIPKIIHQVWSDKYKPLPDFCASLAETWKEKHPDWKYIYWNEEMMNSFVDLVYPGLSECYHSLLYDVQRWDAVRFLILYKMGGMYVDFDYECLKNIEPLLPEGKDCCIATEPQTHASTFHVQNLLSNALLASVPKSVFIRKIIYKIFSACTLSFEGMDKFTFVLKTTGPVMISRIYESLSPKEKKSVHLLPAKNVTPFDIDQMRQMNPGTIKEEQRNGLKEAYAIHYFTCSWV
ncbi:MAG: hypothetical protein LBL07_10645 [Tannerella sp.]|jgi:hypothetical protein|nr:hypothetical protein [Tannerella sp.]